MLPEHLLNEQTQDHRSGTRRGRELVQSYREEEEEAGCPVRLGCLLGLAPGVRSRGWALCRDLGQSGAGVPQGQEPDGQQVTLKRDKGVLLWFCYFNL